MDGMTCRCGGNLLRIITKWISLQPLPTGTDLRALRKGARQRLVLSRVSMVTSAWAAQTACCVAKTGNSSPLVRFLLIAAVYLSYRVMLLRKAHQKAG